MVYMEFHNYQQEAYAASLAKKHGGGGNVNVTSTLQDRTPVPQPIPLDDGEVKWGKPSQFSWGKNKQDFSEGIVPSTTWNFSDNPEDPQSPDPSDNPSALEALTEQWDEKERKETLVRISGPGGAYVDFKRIDEVTFKLPNLTDGREHIVVMRFKTYGDESTTPKDPGNGSGGSGASGAVGVDSSGIIRDPHGGGSL